jgi:Protein of unknown function (DUF1573)
MSKRLLSITMLFALLLTASFAGAQEAAKGPRLTIVDPLKDFGTVPKGTKLDWKFEIKNTGTTDLEVIAAKPSCGCTVADFDKLIKPGATGKVHAAVDTASFVGPISKGITIETNDPNTPSAQVTITAVVKPFVEAHPVGYVRYNMLQGDVEKQSLVLYSEETEPFEITKIDTPQEWIKVEYEKLEGDAVTPNLGRKGQNQYRIDVTTGGPEASVGPLAEKIRILTNSKHQPEYMISVMGVIRPPFRIEPSGINFGEVAPSDTAATRTILLRSNSLKNPEQFVVNKVESHVPGVAAKVEPTGNKGEYQVTLQIDKDAKAGALDGSVTIHTSDRVHPKVDVTVKGLVKSAS